MSDLNTITPEKLMRRIGLPDSPLVVDVRIPEDLTAAPFAIPTSIRWDFQDVGGLIERAADRDCIVVCHKGLKLSQGVAALLRNTGTRAEVLKGGHVAWTEAALPSIPASAYPASDRWVTRHRPKIDRIACPWLIRRFVDPDAAFMFVPPSDVLDVANRFDAIPFDIEGVHFTHRGTGCTFDAMIADFGLSHPALDRLADVVRAADTNTHDANPQAAGLLAVSVGLSRMFKDDTAQLDAGMLIYDALYRWARDGFDEGHDWPMTRPV